MSQQEPSDKALLAEWYADRGQKAAKLNPSQEAALIPILRERRQEIENPKPLEFCEKCQVLTRGQHRSV